MLQYFNKRTNEKANRLAATICGHLFHADGKTTFKEEFVTAGGVAIEPTLALATCTLIWGSTFLLIRIGNDTVAPAGSNTHSTAAESPRSAIASTICGTARNMSETRIRRLLGQPP